MKTRDFSRFSAWILAGVMAMAVAACEEDKQPNDITAGPSAPLTVETLIFDPKVASPNDTLLFTAVITSEEPNETDVPTVEWTATGGTFVEDNQQTVRWVAPATAGVFRVSVRATNDANSSTQEADVFVGGGQTVVLGAAGQIELIGTGPDFHFLASAFVSSGVDVWSYSGGIVGDANAPNFANNLTVTYSPDGTKEAHSADTTAAGATVRPRNVYVGTFGGGSIKRLTTDGTRDGNLDHNQFQFPAFSPNSQLLAYQRWAQSWDGIAPDSFHVYIHDLVALTQTKVTYEHAFPRAVCPTFSTDGNWLTYVVDIARNGNWELYGSPMTGNTVDGSIASLVQMTDTGGSVVSGAPKDVRKPPMIWNPVSSVMALNAADNNLYLVTTTGTGGSAIQVSGITRVLELVWSPGGSMLVATTGARIVTITPTGALTERFTAIGGDNVRDLLISPDENWLVFRTTRGGGSWFSALDLGVGAGAEPVAITPSDPAGLGAQYRGFMSLAPVWTSSNIMYYPTFLSSDDETPGILLRDLSGLVN